MSVQPIPDGYHAVTPYLTVSDPAAAIDFYKKAFGAVEHVRMTGPNGAVVHAEVAIGDSRVMLGGECPVAGTRSPASDGGTPVSLLVYVEDVDARFRQALAAGAREKRPVKDQFYGDRTGVLADPFGHVWSLATHVEDVSHQECQRRVDEMMKAASAAA